MARNPSIARHAALTILAAIVCLSLFPSKGWATVKENRQEVTTRNQAVGFTAALKNYWGEYGRFPRGDPRMITAILRGENIEGQNPLRIVFLEGQPRKTLLGMTTDPGSFDPENRLLDGYHRPFQFGIGAEGFPIVLRSLGKNGVDDHGEPDDFQTVILPGPPGAASPPAPAPALTPPVRMEKTDAIPTVHPTTIYGIGFVAIIALLLVASLLLRGRPSIEADGR